MDMRVQPIEATEAAVGQAEDTTRRYPWKLGIVIALGAGLWAVADCSLAAENLMLAAHAAGLGTCWIGFAQGWLGTPEGKSALKLPETDIPIAPIIVGHPKSVPPAVSRKPPRIDWIT